MVMERVLWRIFPRVRVGTRRRLFARLREEGALPREVRQERFQRFFDGSWRTMYAAALRELGDRFRAEDAVQGAYLYLLERFGGAVEELERLPRGYLVTLAVWKARDLGQKERRYVYGGETAWEETPEERDAAGALEDRERLEWLLSAAPEGYRELLRLRLVLGLSNRETARYLGLSENTASVRYRRGVEHLRKLMRKEGEL